MQLGSGTRLATYEVISPLGAGGMGEVYLARDTHLDRRVALKLLPSRSRQDDLAAVRFRREALTLAALNHPNIATIHGLEELPDGRTVLVMELVEGETLAARIARNRLTVDEALSICIQVAEALEVAHEHGIVHLDMKPDNVMLGPRGLVKVLDFGLARRTTPTRPATVDDGSPTIALENVVTAASTSAEEQIAGTPGFMSPEQVLGLPTDARSDVFAFGSVLYECLAGRHAFAGAKSLEVLAATLHQAVDMNLLPAAVPAHVRALIARCLEKQPDARVPDMRAVRETLEGSPGVERASATPTPNNLPAETTSFVGRADVLRECEQLMKGTRLLTLLGIGGAGKTRVAQRLGEAALSRFHDGVWLVNLASIADDRHVVDLAAAALGVQEEPGRSPLQALIHHVRDRRMLLVVDNCEHVLEGSRALVAGILAGCADSCVLTTSREPLHISGEVVFSVPALAIPSADAADIPGLMDVESVRLFVERARATQPDFSLTREEAADVVEICRRLDGIPLALELAAARVRMLGVGQIRARLGDRFKLLARPGAGSSRQQTLLATIQWSWDHLLPPEQDLMMRLAVFAGGWTLERAAAVVSDSGDEFEVLDVLTRLAERSFVVVDRQASAFARYRFLESVHQFALEKLRADPAHDVIRERHLETYLQLAVSAKIALTGPRQAQMLEELKHEEENVIAALSWCGRAADGARRRLVLAESMTRFWMLLGRYDLGRRILEEAIERDAGNPPSAARALALTRAAGAATTVGDHESARLRLEESLAFWKSSEDKSGLPAVVAGLGVIAMYQERFEDALRLFEESLALYEQRGQTRGIAMTLHNLGTIETALERPGHGRAHFERALGMFREIGDHSTETLCLGALTVSRLRGGDVEAARRSMLECFDRLAALESPREGAYAIDAFVELLLVTGRSSDAARFIGAAEATRATYHLEVLPLERAEMDRLASRVRATLGSDEMERVIASGRKLTLASAVVEGTRILRSRPVVS